MDSDEDGLMLKITEMMKEIAEGCLESSYFPKKIKRSVFYFMNYFKRVLMTSYNLFDCIIHFY